MDKPWTDAKILYFHFTTDGGLFASLPMVRVLQAFASPFVGVPGTKEVIHDGKKAWVVPGFKCLNCAKTFFVADRDSLKHECMKNGGIISESGSMGVNGD